MWRQIFSVIVGAILLPTFLLADDSLWVQIEAQPSLLEAEDRARKYAVRLPNVHAFSLGSGWYAIAVGPFTQDEIELEYQNLRNTLEIPFDSFISTGVNFRQKIWPSGLETAESTDTPGATNIFSQTVEKIEGYDLSAIDRSEDETLDQARKSESILDRSAKKELQRALQWAGYYSSSIDGMFGTGTRNSMKQWQNANQFPATGVLSTLQRNILIMQYHYILTELGIEKITDLQTGVVINLPMGVLEFSHYDPPLAHFKATDGGPQAAYVISQKGDRAALRALYRALQTLSLLPPDGSRKLLDDSFSISGQNSQITSFAQAFLSQGE
ncbi:MAG: peptidoglycan-binding protein, partial [Marinovum sp.]|nr:peptidoglycan-binding protein [Marinovum sp.]